MDPQTPSHAALESLAATLHNAIIDKAERNEFSNTAGDTIKLTVNNYNFTTEGENLVLESSDAIDFFRNVAQPFLAEVRKNDRSRSTVGETTTTDCSDPVPHVATTVDHTSHSSTTENLVDITDIVPPEPSSLPVTSIADMYTRSMLKCLRGYPLYDPKPFCELSNEYMRNGINVGDVGFVRESGTFDFLFNICPSQNGVINPPNLPDDFSLEIQDHAAATRLEALPQNTRLFQSPITKTQSDEYICEGSEGAVLELPNGAVQGEATNRRPFAKFAARHGVQWYEYTMNRGRDISNGSLYLITSVTKCDQWGIAVFDRPCAVGQGLKFEKKRSLSFGKSTSKYHWKGSDTFSTKVSNPNQRDTANQCVFVRGYKIMIRQDIFDNISNDEPRRSDSTIPSSSPQAGNSGMTRQRATRIRGGGGPDPVSRLSLSGLFSRTTMTKSDEEVILHQNFNSSIPHPSDFINTALLNQNPGVKVALTHDDVWCNLLQDNFPKLNSATLIDIARSYTGTFEYDCVYLEKISPSIVLKESSHQLQATGPGSPTLQERLASPDEDYNSVSPPNSLTLPRELVERILLLLDTKSMLKCRLINREFNATIQSSTLVQYFLACKAAGVIDNTRSTLSYGERLEALKKREEVWRKLEPVFETTIKANDEPSTFYQLTAGNYFRGNENSKDLYYCHLPSSPQDNTQWSRIAGCGPGQSWSGSIVTMEVAAYEHDLLVYVISSEVGNPADMQRHSLDLVLLEFSTREYHPLAHHPLIHVQRSPSAQPYSSVRIVGDNLALIIHDQDGSKLFIFDWKTGHKRLQHKTIENAYERSAPVFLSPELLLIPNCNLSHFEVWDLFLSHHNPNPPVQILSLQTPAISDAYSVISIYCSGELKPFLHSMPYFPPRPFFSSPENSIITVNFHLNLKSLPGSRSGYKLIMHRCALLDMIQKQISPSLPGQKEGLPTWLTTEVTMHKVSDPDDGSVRFGAQSESVSTMSDPWSSPRLRDSPTLAPSAPHISTDSCYSSIPSGSTSSTSRYNILQVQWADWGPPISRWFQIDGTYKWWVHQSAGQRYAFLVPNPRDKKKYMVGVADFNLHNIRRNTEMMKQLRGDGEDNGDLSNNGEGKKGENVEELEMLDHGGVFSEDVYMGLKCVVYHMSGEYEFDGVLMDEERLLGLKLNSETQEESIKVFYFG